MWRDFRGNVILQKEQDGAGLYVFDVDHLGIGHRSYGVGKAGKSQVINSATYYLGRYAPNGKALFLTLEGVFEPRHSSLNKVVLLEEDFVANYSALSKATLNIKGLRSVSVSLKDGEGRLITILSDPLFSNGAELQALVNSLLNMAYDRLTNNLNKEILNKFREVTFIHQNGDITTAYDIGALHLGYGKRADTYPAIYDDNGDIVFNEAQYSVRRPVSQTIQGSDFLRRVGGTDENSEIRFVYNVKETRRFKDSIRERSLDHAGRIRWRFMK